MNIKILVATHKKYDMPTERIYLPIHVGKAGKESLGYQGDDIGDNISWKNTSYCFSCCLLPELFPHYITGFRCFSTVNSFDFHV